MSLVLSRRYPKTNFLEMLRGYAWSKSVPSKLMKTLVDDAIPWNDKVWNLAAQKSYAKKIGDITWRDIYEFVVNHEDYVPN
jgi:hypothetical protein